MTANHSKTIVTLVNFKGERNWQWQWPLKGVHLLQQQEKEEKCPVGAFLFYSN